MKDAHNPESRSPLKSLYRLSLMLDKGMVMLGEFVGMYATTRYTLNTLRFINSVIKAKDFERARWLLESRLVTLSEGSGQLNVFEEWAMLQYARVCVATYDLRKASRTTVLLMKHLKHRGAPRSDIDLGEKLHERIRRLAAEQSVLRRTIRYPHPSDPPGVRGERKPTCHQDR